MTTITFTNLIFVQFFYFVAIHCSPAIVPLISHGSVAKATDWPSQVLITNPKSRLVCGGSLISEEWVLTAAHCASKKRWQVGDPYKHILTMGAQNRRKREKNQVIRKVKEVVVFEKYEIQNHSFDLALIKMDKPIDFNKHPNLKPMCLDLCKKMDWSEKKCIATGFGSIDNDGDFPDELQQLEMKPFDHDECKKIHENFYKGKSKERVTDLQFCMVSEKAPAKQRDKSNGGCCPGDSGGPVQCKLGSTFFQTGVAWSTTDCETKPTVFQSVSKWADFITNTTGYQLPDYCKKDFTCH